MLKTIVEIFENASSSLRCKENFYQLGFSVNEFKTVSLWNALCSEHNLLTKILTHTRMHGCWHTVTHSANVPYFYCEKGLLTLKYVGKIQLTVMNTMYLLNL